MEGRALARFIVFAVFHVLLCVSAALYAGEFIAGLMLVDMPDSRISIDGADFTGFFSFLALSVNGMLSSFIAVIFFGAMTIFSVVLLIPFRFIAVRKHSVVTKTERNATLAAIGGGVVLAALAALILFGIDALPALLLFLIPTLLIEMLMYWLTLYFKCR